MAEAEPEPTGKAWWLEFFEKFDLGGIERRLDRIEDSIGALGIKLNSMEKLIMSGQADFQAALDSIQTEVASVQSDVGSLKAAVANVLADIATLNAAVAAGNDAAFEAAANSLKTTGAALAAADADVQNSTQSLSAALPQPAPSPAPSSSKPSA